MASERDSLIGRPGSSYQPTLHSKCQVASNWALTLAVFLLVIILFINGSASFANLTQPVESSAAAADKSPTKVFGPHTKGRYYATQFISFTINTLGGSASDGECEGRPVDPKADGCDDIETDVNHRLTIIEDVLRTIKNDQFKEEPEIDRDPRVLKILMLPEFTPQLRCLKPMEKKENSGNCRTRFTK
jgi:hypothetical protein